jgi:serine/threonine protein kinase
MRFQCTFCSTIIRHEGGGERVVCPNCKKQVAVPRDPFERGCVIDDFVIDSIVGYGGMATVYLAKQLSMDRPVAMKVLSDEYSQRETFRKAFLKEAKAAARLNHPNLIQAMKVGEEGGRLFYAMEYVQGQTLAQKIETEKNLEIDVALNIVQQSAEALHAAWTQEGLIHRDIKPDNIMLAEDGYAKIMDLGIAIRVDETEKVEVSGTPAYMAPEQFRRERLDCRTDIYSLGATLFHSLVGFPPFDGDTVQDVARAHVFEQLQFPDNNLVYLPQRIKRLIGKMMAKDPADRYQDYEELLGDLVAIRKRLAPDEDQVPSVHTISFSKYRLYERMADSPSEMYRKRSEKKKKVAIAREVRVPKEEGPKYGPWIVVGVLVGVIVLLSLVVLWLDAGRDTPFVKQAEELLAQAPTGEPAGTVLALEQELNGVDDLLAGYPERPNAAERRAAQGVRNYRERLQEKRFSLLQRDLEQQRVLLNRELEVLKGNQQKLLADRKAFEQDRRDFEALNADARKTQEAGAARQAELKAAQDRLAEETASLRTLEKALADKRARMLRELQYTMEWRIIDECRAYRFPDARAVLADVTQVEPDLKEWAARKEKLLTSAERVYRAVYNSGAAFKGEAVSQGKIINIDRADVRLSVEKDGIVSYLNVDLSGLEPPEVVGLAAKNWTGDAPVQPAQYDFALCTGEFGLAQKILPDVAAGSEFQDLVRGCLDQLRREILLLLQTNRKLAFARYKFAKAACGDLKEFKAVDDEVGEAVRKAAAKSGSMLN